MKAWAILALVALPRLAHADEAPPVLTPQSPSHATSPSPRPTLPWMILQLVPSPGVWIAPETGSVNFALAWQVTPVLYSFGLNRRIDPWRFLVVDPLARVSGSLELHVSPEWMPEARTALFFRAGLRTTLPLHQHGEYLALMLGTSYARFGDANGVVYEGGLTVLFGSLGLVGSYSPTFSELRYGVRIQLRAF